MSTEKYFSIIVKGSLSSEAEEGELDKVSGLPSGPTSKIKLQVGGMAIPNSSKVWAQRVKDKKDQPTGELKFLPWRHKDGELVQIRYLEGVGTLDKIYQDTVLKVGPKTQDDEKEIAYIDLSIGVNDFNVEVTDPMLIEMIRHHTYCENNESRNPSSKEIHFAIYDPKNINSNKVEKMRLDKEAQDIILSAETDSRRAEILAVVFELDPRSQHEVLFNNLLDILEDDKKRVLDAVNFHKSRFKHLLTKLEEAGDLEYTDTDVILTLDHDRKPLITDLPTKNHKVYLEAHILDPDIWAVYQEVLEIDKKLVEQLN